MRLLPLLLSVMSAFSIAGAAESLQRVKIANGTMTAGTDQPSDWERAWTGSGTITGSRDTTVFHSAPAALRVSTGDATGEGSRSQFFDCPAGSTIHLTGWVKTSGGVQTNVFAQAFSVDWKPIDFLQLAYRHDNAASEWSTWEGTATMPEGGVRWSVGVLIKGQGTAWLDDVRDVQDPESTSEEEVAAAAKKAQADAAADPNDITRNSPAKATPATPGWGFYKASPLAWQAMFNGQLARTAQGNVDVVFLGDSITQGWSDAGKTTWEQQYLPRKAVNYGIGGDSTRQVLWRLDHGLVQGLTPKLVVLAIGTNNLYDDFNSGTDDEIAAGIAAVASSLRQKLPTSKILVLGMLPRQNDWFCSRIAHINGKTAQLADKNLVSYLDMTAAFLSAPGTVSAELYNADKLHLVAAGYSAWNTAMTPLFEQLMR